MDYQGFATRKEAQAEANKMRGWQAKVVKMYLPGNPNADKDGYVWVIQCDSRKYLREDGFVR
jgi:flagellar basal body rod protein FlgC